MKYKVGDKVKIVSEGVGHWNNDGMDKWLNKVMTVRNIEGEDYKMEEDIYDFGGRGWYWEECMIDGLADEMVNKPLGETENLMPYVAARLGVEIGEEFNIAGVEGLGCDPYKFTEEGIFDCEGDLRDYLLRPLLTGKWKIIKKTWRPKDGEYYYYVDVDGSIEYDYFSENSIFDRVMLIAKNYFKTRQEAEADKENVREKLGLEEWIKY